MSNLQELIPLYLRGGPGAATAMKRLVESGPAALAAVLAHAKDKMVPAPLKLMPVIAAAADASTVDQLLGLIADPRPELSHTALLALGYIGDPRATRPIVELLTSPTSGPVICVPAATALTHLRDVAARPPLRLLVSGWVADGRAQAIERFLNNRPRFAFNLMWPLMTTVALAALGDQEFASLAYDIVSLPKQRLAQVSGGEGLFGSLCSMLRHFAVPGLLAACKAALQDADDDSRVIVAEILAGIGTREAFAMLVEIAGTGASTVSESAAAYLDRAAGAELPGSEDGHYGDISAAWWNTTSQRFQDGTVYWGGQPWTPDVLFDALRGEAEVPDQNLLVVTGVHLGQEMRRRKLTREMTIKLYRMEAKRKLATGKLHRYGHTFDPHV
jgi:PBS lyase HEAT-like repeat-containing protein